jgi:hypothetical protein
MKPVFDSEVLHAEQLERESSDTKKATQKVTGKAARTVFISEDTTSKEFVKIVRNCGLQV